VTTGKPPAIRVIRLIGAGAFAGALCLGGCVQADTAALEHGVIVSAIPADQPGENTDAVAVAGVLIGAAAGGGLGRGAGQVLAAAGGAVAGAALGTAAEAAAQHHDGVAYTVRLTDSRVVTIIEHLDAGAPIYAVGTSVTIETRGHVQRVIPTAA
jgi:outer membrane lipoprotein SlyB